MPSLVGNGGMSGDAATQRRVIERTDEIFESYLKVSSESGVTPDVVKTAQKKLFAVLGEQVRNKEDAYELALSFHTKCESERTPANWVRYHLLLLHTTSLGHPLALRAAASQALLGHYGTDERTFDFAVRTLRVLKESLSDGTRYLPKMKDTLTEGIKRVECSRGFVFKGEIEEAVAKGIGSAKSSPDAIPNNWPRLTLPEALHSSPKVWISSRVNAWVPIVRDALNEYRNYRENHCRWSLFHRHGRTGVRRAKELLTVLQHPVADGRRMRDLLDYLSNDANGNTHPHSFRTVLLHRLLKVFKSDESITLAEVSRDYRSQLKALKQAARAAKLPESLEPRVVKII